MFQRRDEERPQAPLFPVHCLQPILGQQLAEKLLRQILGVVRRLPAAPHEGVERIPIGGADRLERGGRLRGLLPVRRQHDGPSRGWKTRLLRAPGRWG